MAQVRLRNVSGRTSKIGQQVKLAPNSKTSFVNAELGDFGVIGTAATSVPNGYSCLINLLGHNATIEITPVLVDTIIEKISPLLTESPPAQSISTEGKSAYQVALDNGYEGNETQWLLSLKGTDGTIGENGIDGYTPIKGTDYFDGQNGIDGVNGERGLQGIPGQNGSDANVSAHESTYVHANIATAYNHSQATHAPAGATVGADWSTNLSNIPSTFAPASHNQDGNTITTGTLDGDRLPAISTAKKGAVPLTGTPSGKFLKDDGTWAAPTATATVAITEVEIDCGTTPLLETIIAVSNAGITAASKIIGGIAYKAPTGKDLDELEMDALDLKFEALAGSMNVHVKGLDGYISDKFIIWYLVA